MNDLRLSLPAQAFTRTMTTVSRLMFGNALLEIPQEMLGTLGWRRFFALMSGNVKVLKMLSEHYGEADAQFIIGLSAMWNGCGYCAYGHTLAGALLVYRDERYLHPLCPEVIADLLGLRNERVTTRLVELLHEPRHERLQTLVSRMHELRFDQSPCETVDDHLLEAALRMWNWVGECTIVVGLTMKPEDAFCPGHAVGRDKSLLARYRHARAHQRT